MPDSRRFPLAGYLSALPEHADRHPEELIPLADRLLAYVNELAEEPPPDTPRGRGVDDLLETAWAIIANAPGWDTDNEWHDAAVRWRDRYHAYLDFVMWNPPGFRECPGGVGVNVNLARAEADCPRCGTTFSTVSGEPTFPRHFVSEDGRVVRFTP